MFSAYLARPPICRGGALNAKSGILRARRTRPTLPAAKPLRSPCVLQGDPYDSWRQFSSNTCFLKQEAPPVPIGRICINQDFSELHDSEDTFEQNAGFLTSKRQPLAKDGTEVAPMISEDTNGDLFKAVLPHRNCGFDLSYRSPIFPSKGARARFDAVQEKETITEAIDDVESIHDEVIDMDPALRRARFRINRGLRAPVAALAASARHLTEPDNDSVTHRLATQEEAKNISEQIPALLAGTCYGIEDVQAWYEIFRSNTAQIAVQRYLELVNGQQDRARPPVPIFVVLQILRAPYIPARIFRELLACIRKQLNADQWDGSSAMILIVRALRSARVVAPETFDIIVDIARDILLGKDGIGKSYLTDCCNRILKLIAVPTTSHPLRNILSQQAAQVRLVRHMVGHEPELPVTREGYRALINVQLGHKKLQQEIDWAHAKSLSWPPWREDMLGMDASLTYPGRESRALKLLSRMIEAGYAHSHWEKAAKILAGWDTDGSPTIQTRKPLPSLVSSGGIGNTETGSNEEMIWAARITATRTVREAWAAFLTYRKQAVAASKKMSSEPFEAMFEKLFAAHQILQPGSTVVPGDSKETWSDPASEIDVIYVDKEPPTVQELYLQMRKDEVKPSRRLLTSLLANTRELDVGVKYVTKHLVWKHKHVLLNAHDCKTEHIRRVLQTMSPQLLSAFMCHLFSAQPEAKFSFKVKPEIGKATSAAPQEYAFKLLQMGQLRERVVYIGALRGLLVHVSFTQGMAHQGTENRVFVRHSLLMCQSLIQLMEDNEVDQDFTTFRLIVEVYQQVLKQATWPRWLNRSNLVDFVKKTFAYCLHSDSESTEWLPSQSPLPLEAVPDPYHLRLLAETLGLMQDTQGLSELIQWMSQHAADLKKVHQHIRTADKEMQTVMIVSRIFIEGWLVSDASQKGAFDAFADVIGEKLYVPTPEDCAEFISSHEFWVKRHQRYLRFATQHAAFGNARGRLSPSEAKEEDSGAETKHLRPAVQHD